MIIKPTVGRVVWVYRPDDTTDARQPEAALIVYVWDDRLVNVAGFDHNGQPFALTSLRLVQPDDPEFGGNFAVWMPYQKGQAARTEQLEADRPKRD